MEQVYAATPAGPGPDAAAELIEVRRTLERRSHHDPLTGLPNRAALVARIASIEPRHVPAVALVLFDIDDFRDANNAYGHSQGDHLLRMVAARVRGCIRDGDLLAHLGGDEFAVLLEGTDGTAASDLAQRIIAVIRRPFIVAGHPTNFTVSVGIAVGTPPGSEPGDLLRFANLAMHDAKAKGKGRCATFAPAMSDALMLRTRTARELREAMERGEMVVHYQPIVDLASGLTMGHEALVRWQHPLRGLLPPAEFVPLAERTGAIVELGTWVLQTACRQAGAWREARPDDRPLGMAVNVSTHQLDDPAFVSIVAATLEEMGLPARCLSLEVTETSVMADPVGARQAVEALRALGVWLAIDDFGTGYASLTYLRQLHATGVKIDQSFVDGLGRDLEDTTIVAAVIGLAHALGLSIIAEGVESPDQLRILREMGCQYAQGFLLCRPETAEDATAHLERRWFEPSTGVTPIVASDVSAGGHQGPGSPLLVKGAVIDRPSDLLPLARTWMRPPDEPHP